MSIVKKEFSSTDAAPVVLYAKLDADSQISYPVTADMIGRKLAVNVDNYTDANTVYVGKAPIGTATSTNLWQIMKVNITSGAVITWADGDSNFDNIFDNRASLTYV